MTPVGVKDYHKNEFLRQAFIFITARWRQFPFSIWFVWHSLFFGQKPKEPIREAKRHSDNYSLSKQWNSVTWNDVARFSNLLPWNYFFRQILNYVKWEVNIMNETTQMGDVRYQHRTRVIKNWLCYRYDLRFWFWNSNFGFPSQLTWYSFQF